MSISSALTTALTGLTATSRMAEVTASNISNALTEGYARREVQLSARMLGQTALGVKVDGITRHVDKGLLQDLRLSSAGQGFRSTATEFLTRVEGAFGTPDVPSSLSARIANLERSLAEAAARPDSEARLSNVLESAQSLVVAIGEVSLQIQADRQSADNRIAADVKQVNGTLAQIADLNKRIRAAHVAGRDTTALMDQRQKAIDAISVIVPVREVARDHDQVALFTSGGLMLLDGRPARLEFSPTRFITPDMTLASASLSGLSINGQPVVTSPEGGRLGEGRLAALFDLRDRHAPHSQERLDALARDLIERVSTSTVDPSLAVGMAGLFTDGGAALDPVNEVGLASRLRVNTLVDPAAGGALWRLRDGLGAASSGPTGNSSLLTALGKALSDRRLQASGGLDPGARSLSEFASDINSLQSVMRLGAETASAFATARSNGLRAELLRDGVDSDQEMQTLLLVEKAYAANAKVIQTADDMINILLGM